MVEILLERKEQVHIGMLIRFKGGDELMNGKVARIINRQGRAIVYRDWPRDLSELEPPAEHQGCTLERVYVVQA